VLLTERQTALDFPKGDLHLAVCERCGFIQNDSFDPDLVDYTAPYEESQANSATFLRFVDEELADLGERYNLTDRRLVEIGCGKGEWLARACRSLGMSGLGIDPAFVPGRTKASDAELFEIRREFFDEQSQITGDLVACRHTLEHVSNPREFLTWLLDAADGGVPGIAYIEVPDTKRVLAEAAFWDVYYEHSAYFTAISLRNLVGAVGGSELRLAHGFGEQYLLLEARLGDLPPASPQDPSSVAELARTFGLRAKHEAEAWLRAIDSVGADRVALWAATSKTVAFLSAVDRQVAAAVDINPAKHGSYLPGSGVAVHNPEVLRDIDPALVIVMNPNYRDEIKAHVRRLGLESEVVALGDAVIPG
jgi:hypothetical protein